MKKPLIALCLLALTLPFGCTTEEETPPDPLARREGFCEAWAEAACHQEVVDACDSGTIEECRDAQSDFCLGLLPEVYASTHAKACLGAVKEAYRDANLTADELQVVLKLAEPCDKLSKGTSDEGDACEKADDCDTAGGFTCILKLGAAEGTCEEPEEIPAGDDCSGDAQICADGYYCNGDNCVTYKKVGGACDGDYQCAPEARCLIEIEGEPGACTERAALNEPCSADHDCQLHFCLIDAGAAGECASRIRLSRSEPLCDQL